jgi:DNA-binding MarR family transcriptional regulator
MAILARVEHEPLSISDLARIEQVRVPTMSNAVPRMERLGWVRRKGHRDNRRTVLLELTPRGRKLLWARRAHAKASSRGSSSVSIRPTARRSTI